jgi:hypothetical protein
LNVVVDPLINVMMVIMEYLVLSNQLDVMFEKQMVLNKNLINEIVEHRIVIDDVDLLNVVVKQMDHVYLFLIHVFVVQARDVAHHLLVMFYLK